MSMLDHNDKKFMIAMAAVHQCQLRVQYYAKRIETGVWRERIGRVRQGSHDGPFVPEDKLLAEEVATMNRHIELAQEQLDYAIGLLPQPKDY